MTNEVEKILNKAYHAIHKLGDYDTARAVDLLLHHEPLVYITGGVPALADGLYEEQNIFKDLDNKE